jgi:hypothetical protein
VGNYLLSPDDRPAASQPLSKNRSIREASIASREELAAAIAEAGQRHIVWRWEPASTLWATPPRRPAKPVSADVAAAESPTAPAVLEASEGLADSVSLGDGIGGLTASPEAERLHGVAVQLDIGVTRRRLHWWRLAASLVVRRLGAS